MGFVVSTMGCLHDLPITQTGFGTLSGLKRPSFCNLFGLFALKLICLFGAKKPLPLFYLSGCAAWWGEGVFLQIFYSYGAFDRAKSGLLRPYWVVCMICQ